MFGLLAQLVAKANRRFLEITFENAFVGYYVYLLKLYYSLCVSRSSCFRVYVTHGLTAIHFPKHFGTRFEIFDSRKIFVAQRIYSILFLLFYMYNSCRIYMMLLN